jgi:hypothetical protein
MNASSFVLGNHDHDPDIGAGTGPGVPAGDRSAGGSRTGPCVCLAPVPFFQLDDILLCLQTSIAATGRKECIMYVSLSDFNFHRATDVKSKLE